MAGVKTTWFRLTGAKERDEAIEQVGPLVRTRGGEVSRPPGNSDIPPFLLAIEHADEDDDMVRESMILIDADSEIIDPQSQQNASSRSDIGRCPLARIDHPSARIRQPRPHIDVR
jgi:hypothetical protein